MEFQQRAIHHDGVPRIDAALVADHQIRRATQQIRDFSFSFVTPLGTDNNNIRQGIRAPRPCGNKTTL